MLERVMEPGLYLGCMAWLGRQDSNLRMPGPKPGALPLGHDPLYEYCDGSILAEK